MPIFRCSCQNKIQDEFHGVFRRVFNRAADTPSGLKQFRCTVCEKVITRGKNEDTTNNKKKK